MNDIEDDDDLIFDEETGEYIAYIDTLSYGQRYEYECESRGEKLCRNCNTWDTGLIDGLCECCIEDREKIAWC